jgi:hypothetical protein
MQGLAAAKCYETIVHACQESNHHSHCDNVSIIVCKMLGEMHELPVCILKWWTEFRSS